MAGKCNGPVLPGQSNECLNHRIFICFHMWPSFLIPANAADTVGR